MSQHPSLTRERSPDGIAQTRVHHAHGPLADRGHTKKYVAELIGTFLLVFIGTSAVVAFGGPFANGVATVGYVGIALAFGLTLVVLAYTLGPVSGGHFNPAVTIGLVAARRHPLRDLLPYIVSQIVGAVLASGLLYLIASGKPGWTIASGLGQNSFGTLAVASALAAETVFTFVLVFVVLSVTNKSYPYTAFGGLAIGVALLAIHLGDIGWSGSGVNPARSIGPALFVGGTALSQLWVYIVAPIVGGLIAAGVYTAVRFTQDAPAPSEEVTSVAATSPA
ncbi:MAG: aquaporin [Actinomycetota bacterium]|nr:aquaporin [Actinomycetota bacterium]